jgi:benzoylformate decarboxylase
MADGYARATHRPAVVNVHIAPGLANAMSMIYNAAKGGAPLVVTVGQQDTRMLFTEPFLSADLVRFAQPWVKWAGETARGEDVPAALRRAFKIAAEPPQGPVVLSLPQDVLDQPVTEPLTPTPYTAWGARPDPAAIEQVARLLAGAKNPLIMCGDNCAIVDASAEVAALAELAGAPVMQGTGRQWNFPTTHPLYIGPLGFMGGMRENLEAYDVIVAIGAGNPFLPLFYEGGSPIPAGCALVHMDVDTYVMGKDYPAAHAIYASPKWGARDLHEALDKAISPAQRNEAQRRRAAVAQRTAEAREKAEAQMKAEWDKDPISAMRLVGEIRDAAPKDAAYVGSGGTSGRGPFSQLIPLTQPNSFFEGGAALGFPLPGTLGVALALPNRPVIGLLREGDSMYSIQGLWTAAHYNIPCTWVVFNNASYRILKLGMVRYLGETPRKSDFMGMDFGEPAIDISKQAAVWGIHNKKVTHADELRPALDAALAHNGPSLVDVSIETGYRQYF